MNPPPPLPNGAFVFALVIQCTGIARTRLHLQQHDKASPSSQRGLKLQGSLGAKRTVGFRLSFYPRRARHIQPRPSANGGRLLAQANPPQFASIISALKPPGHNATRPANCCNCCATAHQAPTGHHLSPVPLATARPHLTTPRNTSLTPHLSPGSSQAQTLLLAHLISNTSLFRGERLIELSSLFLVSSIVSFVIAHCFHIRHCLLIFRLTHSSNNLR